MFHLSRDCDPSVPKAAPFIRLRSEPQKAFAKTTVCAGQLPTGDQARAAFGPNAGNDPSQRSKVSMTSAGLASR
jgi:hypothetical protein